MKSTALIFTFLFIIAGNLFLKIYPRRHIKMHGDDTWGMLLWARKFKNKAPKKDFCDFLISGEKFYYPELFLKFLSLFKESLVLKFNWLFSPLFDSLSLALVFFLSYFLSNNLLIAFLSCMIYILFPPLVFQSTFLSARALGYLLSNITIILLIFAKHFNSFPYLIAAIALGGLLLNVHLFSTQALIFVILGLSLLEKTSFYAVSLPLVFIGGLILSGGFYLTVLSGHFKIIRTHYRTIHSTPYAKFNFMSSVLKSLFWGFVLLLINLFARSAEINPLVLSLSNWSIVLFAVFILTTFITPLRCIGEGYRYMEFAIVPISILFGHLLLQYNNSLYILILLLFVLYVSFSFKKIRSYFSGINKDYINIVDDFRLKMLEFIKSSSIERILCLPNGMSQSCAYFTGKKVLWTYYDWDNFSWLFPQLSFPLKVNLAEVIKRYRLDAVLLHTRFAKGENLKISYRLIHREGPYLLLGVERQ